MCLVDPPRVVAPFSTLLWSTPYICEWAPPLFQVVGFFAPPVVENLFVRFPRGRALFSRRFPQIFGAPQGGKNLKAGVLTPRDVPPRGGSRRARLPHRRSPISFHPGAAPKMFTPHPGQKTLSQAPRFHIRLFPMGPKKFSLAREPGVGPTFTSRSQEGTKSPAAWICNSAYTGELRRPPAGRTTCPGTTRGRKVFVSSRTVLGTPRTTGHPADNQSSHNPGRQRYLSLDLGLQTVAQEGLREELEKVCSPGAGVVIALDPRDGEVLALVSLPTYDNNFFAQGITKPEDTRSSTIL